MVSSFVSRICSSVPILDNAHDVHLSGTEQGNLGCLVPCRDVAQRVQEWKLVAISVFQMVIGICLKNNAFVGDTVPVGLLCWPHSASGEDRDGGAVGVDQREASQRNPRVELHCVVFQQIYENDLSSTPTGLSKQHVI